MATYNNVATAKHATLVASTVDTVNFASAAPAYEITNLSTSADMYARTDGTSPTVAGDDTTIVRAGDSVTLRGARSSQVRLISSGTPEYHLEQLSA